MAKLVKLEDEKPGITIVFYCPGCRTDHPFRVARDGETLDHPVWTWNGDMEKPTFLPSLLCWAGSPNQCHLFLREGKIEYLSDCHHELRGQTIDLGEIDW